MDDIVQLRSNKKVTSKSAKFSSVRIPDNYEIFSDTNDFQFPPIIDLMSENGINKLQVKAKEDVKKTCQVFGIGLSRLLERERSELNDSEKINEVPSIVTQIFSYFREHGGIREPGLFRLCGRHSELLNAKILVDSGIKMTHDHFKEMSIHTVGDLLKNFLRSLPSPVIPVDYFWYFLASNTFENKQISTKYLGSLLRLLPIDNFNLLKCICDFFREVIRNSKQNMMNSANLSIIFAPSLFGQSTVSDCKQVLFEAQITSLLVQIFIERFIELFEVEYKTIEVLIAHECYNESFSLIKGEEVLVFGRGEEFSDTTVNGKYLRMDNTILLSKCRPKDLSIIEENKPQEVRSMALAKLSATTPIRLVTARSENYISLKKNENNENNNGKGRKSSAGAVIVNNNLNVIDRKERRKSHDESKENKECKEKKKHSFKEDFRNLALTKKKEKREKKKKENQTPAQTPTGRFHSRTIWGMSSASLSSGNLLPKNFMRTDSFRKKKRSKPENTTEIDVCNIDNNNNNYHDNNYNNNLNNNNNNDVLNNQ